MRRRRKVKAGDGSYFAGEVIRILGLHHLDYDQLHRLFEIVRGRPRLKKEEDSWRRFSYIDLANLKVAARLIGIGSRKTQRLRLKQLDEICGHLRKEFGIEHPLIQAKLRTAGATIVVELDGKHFDARTTQLVFDEVARDVATYEETPVPAGTRAEPVCTITKPKSTGGVYEAPALGVGRAR
jgi:hypothetical protein